MTMRQLTRDEVTFTVELDPEEYTLVRGNVLASGDDQADKAVEDEIIARLKRDDTSAWCCIMVKARWKGHEGVNSLGCVSLAETNTGAECQELVEEFAKEHGMYEQALADLNSDVANYVADGKYIEQLLTEDAPNYIHGSYIACVRDGDHHLSIDGHCNKCGSQG